MTTQEKNYLLSIKVSSYFYILWASVLLFAFIGFFFPEKRELALHIAVATAVFWTWTQILVAAHKAYCDLKIVKHVEKTLTDQKK